MDFLWIGLNPGKVVTGCDVTGSSNRKWTVVIIYFHSTATELDVWIPN